MISDEKVSITVFCCILLLILKRKQGITRTKSKIKKKTEVLDHFRNKNKLNKTKSGRSNKSVVTLEFQIPL